MEFENYERELKYLIKKNEKYTSKQFLEFLCENGYKLVESFEKEKHETYYDDNDFSILKRGDVMRGSNMVTEQFKGFLYKTNKCNPQKPYVSKLELGTKLRGQYKDVNEFIKELVEIVGKHGCKMEDIIALFKQHDKNVFVEEIHNGEFDYLIRFSEENEDPYYYCFHDEGCHIIYHRFLPEDYEDFGF